jgi:hypothetical protein
MRGTTVCFLVILAAGSGGAQTPEVVTIPEGDLSGATVFDGFISNPYSAQPPSLPLIPKTPEARRGGIWLRSDKNGLHIWGQVDGGKPNWPQQNRDMLAKDHIEVWLAAATDVPMPPIGWGNQFGTIELKSRDDCSKPEISGGPGVTDAAQCEQWYNEQVHYRSRFRRLFVRQWLIAKNHVDEVYARSAYDDLSADLFKEFLPAALQPKGTEQVQAGTLATPNTKGGGKHTGYEFYVFIPYTAFPPARQLDLRDLWLMVDVFSPAPEGRKMGAYSSTSATRKWGDPTTFNHVQLGAPLKFALSPCECPLEEDDIYGRKYPAWFFPAPALAPDKLVIVAADYIADNPVQGGMYDPGMVSPEFVEHRHFWRQLQDGAWICGPKLVWRKGAVVKKGNFAIDEESFDTKPLPDGWSLVRSGPSASTVSQFGSGQCGSAPVASLYMFAISPAGEISPALGFTQDLGCSPDNPDDADLEISPDWQRITIYLQFQENESPSGITQWYSTTYCLKSHVYKQCAEKEDATPPNPRNFTFQ